jgi:HSP20 family protein
MFDYNFGDPQGEGWSDQPVFHPACEIEETESHYLMSVDLPGISKNDINIEVKNNQLFITGERKYENKNRRASERFYGKFHRVVTLPTGLNSENIEAQYQDGVLTVALPKAESAKPKQIKISEGKGGFFGKLLGVNKKSEKLEKEASAINAA